MNVKALLIALALAVPAQAQGVEGVGFAGLGAAAEGFALPERGRALRFPQDHGAHPDFRIEWWYVTAVLEDAAGAPYGAQWTLFRTALAPGAAPGFESPQVWFAHAALTSGQRHLVAERVARGGIGQAGVVAAPFAAWIDEWSMQGKDGIAALSLEARDAAFAYTLDLTATGPLVAHGEGGFSLKSASGQASHYYSQPFYEVSGQINLEGETRAVTGKAWLDREWSSQPLAPDQSGWDWFALVFADGARLMGFHLRDSGPGFVSGTWISPEGAATPLAPGALRLTPLGQAEVAGRRVPVEWRVELPEQGVNVVASALNPQAWMDVSLPYWEGPVRFTGSHEGRGYLEMTGY